MWGTSPTHRCNFFSLHETVCIKKKAAIILVMSDNPGNEGNIFVLILVLGGIILFAVVHIMMCLCGAIYGALGCPEPPPNVSRHRNAESCKENSLNVACMIGFLCARPIGLAACFLPMTAGRGVYEVFSFFQAWSTTDVNANSEIAQKHLKRSAVVMLTGSVLSLICMLVAFTSPWVVIKNADSPTFFIRYWPMGTDKCDAPTIGCKNFLLYSTAKAFYPAGDSPDELNQALGSFDIASKASSVVLSLSFVSQCFAFYATLRARAAVYGGAGVSRVFAREASMNFNALTFLMMIFCTSTYSSTFSGVIKALNAKGASSTSLEPGLAFAFSAAFFSFLSLAMVSAPCFRQAWRGTVTGASAPLLVSAPIPPPSSSTTGLEKTALPRHLERELLEVAEGKETECPVCLEKITTATGTYTKCGHLFCKECVEKLRKEKSRCPTCRGAL